MPGWGAPSNKPPSTVGAILNSFQPPAQNYPGAVGVPGGSPTATGWNPQMPYGGTSNPGFSQPGTQTPFKSTAQNNPMLSQTYGDVRNFTQALSKNQDAAATAAMGRGRDLISGMANEFGQMTGRGTFGSGVAAQGIGNILTKGSRDLAATNIGLADSARKETLSALNSQTTAANATAGNLLGQQQYGLAQWQAQNGAANNAAQLAAMQNQNQFNQMMTMLNMFGG